MFASQVSHATRPQCPNCRRTYDDPLQHCTGCGRELVTPSPNQLPWTTVRTGRSNRFLAISSLGFVPLLALAGTVTVLGPTSSGIVLDDTELFVLACWYAFSVGAFFAALATAPGSASG